MSSHGDYDDTDPAIVKFLVALFKVAGAAITITLAIVIFLRYVI